MLKSDTFFTSNIIKQLMEAERECLTELKSKREEREKSRGKRGERERRQKIKGERERASEERGEKEEIGNICHTHTPLHLSLRLNIGRK